MAIVELVRVHDNFVKNLTHLSKGASNLKQNGTQEEKDFFARFFKAFLVAWSILFRLLKIGTIKLKLLIGRWKGLTNRKVVSGANTRNKKTHTTRKGIPKQLFQKMVPFLGFHFVWGSKTVLKDVLIQNLYTATMVQFYNHGWPLRSDIGKTLFFCIHLSFVTWIILIPPIHVKGLSSGTL